MHCLQTPVIAGSGIKWRASELKGVLSRMQPAHASSALLRLPPAAILGDFVHVLVLHCIHSPDCSASESLAVVVGAVAQAGLRYVLIREAHFLCLSSELSLDPTTGKAVSEREKRETSGVATPFGRHRCEVQTIPSARTGACWKRPQSAIRESGHAPFASAAHRYQKRSVLWKHQRQSFRAWQSRHLNRL